jgi:hypothetical protein
MEEKKENQFIDADRFLDGYEAKIEAYEPSSEVLEEFGLVYEDNEALDTERRLRNVITPDGNSIPLHPRATRCESSMKESVRRSET